MEENRLSRKMTSSSCDFVETPGHRHAPLGTQAGHVKTLVLTPRADRISHLSLPTCAQTPSFNSGPSETAASDLGPPGETASFLSDRTEASQCQEPTCLGGKSSTAKEKGSPETERSPQDAPALLGPAHLDYPINPSVLPKQLVTAELYHLQVKES